MGGKGSTLAEDNALAYAPVEVVTWNGRAKGGKDVGAREREG